MVNDLLVRAIEELDNLNSGEVFLVRDLFKGYEWNRFERNDRLRLGVLFLNEIQSNGELRIEILDKSSSHQQKYKKL
ncbi:single-stranded DNA-binding protein [Lederbergia citri]|uniref:Single-stranded DNA-binding protein n=1 Tax=Lederbergia citri TaxID=2833580 RepID=A0A942TDN7_9BACI|nr:single-stranded DNA-binding protein [Lederbergia citri]MBS4195788.1 single-stranded DNA-binding protein [Lederbergia citri]